MVSYFPKKAVYDERAVFDRAYYANFPAIDKAVHKFKQKSALQKQGQNLKKISETSKELKEALSEFNSEIKKQQLTENLVKILDQKMEELNNKKKENEEEESYDDEDESAEEEEDLDDSDMDDNNGGGDASGAYKAVDYLFKKSMKSNE